MFMDRNTNACDILYKISNKVYNVSDIIYYISYI